MLGGPFSFLRPKSLNNLGNLQECGDLRSRSNVSAYTYVKTTYALA
jgi:hypothetical protein